MSDSPSKLASDLAEHLRFLAENGLRSVPAAGDPPERASGREAEPAGLLDGPEDLPERREGLEEIRADLGDCVRCKLHTARNKIVFGVGNPDARLLFVGEAPGADEDRQGEPFVGRAGQLLDRIIGAMGLRREDVYIANVLKCRPPGNRTPEADEIGTCSPFLFRQIAALSPELIVALGAPAAHTLLGTHAPIGKLRGRFLRFRGIDLMPTYHPAFLLRSPAKKREVWEDMQQVMARLGLTPPRKS